MRAEKINTPENSDESGADKQQKLILVQVASLLFHNRGYVRVKFSDIARAAGMTPTEAHRCFPSKVEICHRVIATHLENQAARFAEIDSCSNPRQRLSRFLDDIAENADILMSQGCPLITLYFDLHREKGQLREHAAILMQQRLEWISRQFILITRIEGTADFAERLSSALIGITILARVSSNPRLITSQINQLKSWIRSM